MNKAQLYFFSEHIKTAYASNEEINQVIDAAKNRANLGTLGRTGLGYVTGTGLNVPIATLSSGMGVQDPELRKAIMYRTLGGGTLGGLAGGAPGLLYGAGSLLKGDARGLALGANLALVGGVGGELLGQRAALEGLKR